MWRHNHEGSTNGPGHIVGTGPHTRGFNFLQTTFSKVWDLVSNLINSISRSTLIRSRGGWAGVYKYHLLQLGETFYTWKYTNPRWENIQSHNLARNSSYVFYYKILCNVQKKTRKVRHSVYYRDRRICPWPLVCVNCMLAALIFLITFQAWPCHLQPLWTCRSWFGSGQWAESTARGSVSFSTCHWGRGNKCWRNNQRILQ